MRAILFSYSRAQDMDGRNISLLEAGVFLSFFIPFRPLPIRREMSPISGQVSSQFFIGRRTDLLLSA